MTFEFVFGIALGVLITTITLRVLLWYAARRLNAKLSQLIELHKELAENTIFVRLEQLDNTYFVYNLETNAFMAQGQSAQEVRDRLKKDYSRFTVTVADGEEQVLDRFKRELEAISN